MNPLKNTVVLILALLLSQAAIAMHDSRCLDGQHEQTCEIYITQDHSASCDADQIQLDPMVFGEGADGFNGLISPGTFSLLYLSRAPPLHV